MIYFFFKDIIILLTASNKKKAHQSTHGIYKGSKMEMKWTEREKNQYSPIKKSLTNQQNLK